LSTTPVAVPAAKPTKKIPLCKKGQKSTKKKPCRTRKLQAETVRANPPAAGWKFSLRATQNDNGSWGLALEYMRIVGNATEDHTYSFQLAPGSVSVADDLSTFTLATGTQLGQFGAVTMSLAAAGALQPVPAQPGCTETNQTRSGTLRGTVRFVADSTYFKVLVESALPVSIVANTSGAPPTCDTPPPACNHASLFFGGDAATPAGLFYATLTDGTISLVRYVPAHIGPATITTSSLREEPGRLEPLPGREPVDRDADDERRRTVVHRQPEVHSGLPGDLVAERSVRKHDLVRGGHCERRPDGALRGCRGPAAAGRQGLRPDELVGRS
jgi:hypothetical protein